jgi:acylphosphatase
LNATPVARQYTVSGRVQGVGYRRFAQKAAVEVGVDGWVRNLDDGSVEVLVIGTPEQQEEMSGLLRRGPLWADVRTVRESEAAMLELRGFRIR